MLDKIMVNRTFLNLVVRLTCNILRIADQRLMDAIRNVLPHQAVTLSMINRMDNYLVTALNSPLISSLSLWMSGVSLKTTLALTRQPIICWDESGCLIKIKEAMSSPCNYRPDKEDSTLSSSKRRKGAQGLIVRPLPQPHGSFLMRSGCELKGLDIWPPITSSL